MKKLRLLAVGLLVAITAYSCSDDDDAVSVNGNATAVANNLKSGTWRITEFVDDGVDRLPEVAAYDFTFGANGVVTATDGEMTYTGTWSVDDDHDDDNDDDGFDSDIDLDIAFASPLEFANLNDDWDVIERTGIRIRLADDDDDDDVDYLTFEKN